MIGLLMAVGGGLATGLAIGLTINQCPDVEPRGDDMPDVSDAVERAEAICDELQRLMQGKPDPKRHVTALIATGIAALLIGVAVAARRTFACLRTDND